MFDEALSVESPALDTYCLIVPRQNVVSRFNGHDLDSNPGEYLATIRPLGIVAMMRAIRRELPEVSLIEAAGFVWDVRRQGHAEIWRGSHAAVVHLQWRLEAHHRLVAHVVPFRLSI